MKLLNQLRTILPPEKKWLAVGLVLFMIILAVLELATVAMLMPVVSVFANPQSLSDNRVLAFLSQHFHTATATGFITVCALLTVVLSFLKNALSWRLVKMQSALCISIADDLALRLYKKYTNLPGSVFADTDTSVLIIRLNQIYEVTQELIFPVLITAAEGCVFLLFTCAIFILNPLVTVALFIAAAIALVLFYLPVRHKMEASGQDYRTTAEKMQSALAEIFSMDELIRITGTGNHFEERFNEIRKKRLSAQKNAANIGQLPRHAMEVFGVLVIIGTVLSVMLTTESLAQSATVASFFIATFIRMMPGVSRIQYNLLHIRFGKALFEQMFTDLQGLESIPATIQSVPAGKPFPDDADIIVKDVSFAYQDRPPVFQGLNLKIRTNATTAITGQTGCGKSTLIHLLNGYYTPSSGKITVGGIDIQTNLSLWRCHIGYVPQDIHLLNTSILRNVAFGISNDGINTQRVRECLELAGMTDFVNALPQGVDTVIGEDGSMLSGGQRQRIAIARALYHRPKLMLMDEPTSALDADTESAILQSLDRLHGKVTVIIVSHSEATLPHCDEIIRL